MPRYKLKSGGWIYLRWDEVWMFRDKIVHLTKEQQVERCNKIIASLDKKRTKEPGMPNNQSMATSILYGLILLAVLFFSVVTCRVVLGH